MTDIFKQRDVVIKIINDIRKEEISKSRIEKSLEDLKNGIRNDTDLPTVLNKKKPTISDIDSYINNKISVKDKNKEHKECIRKIDHLKRINNVEFEFMKILGRLDYGKYELYKETIQAIEKESDTKLID